MIRPSNLKQKPMGRKKVSELSPEELEIRREYMREAKKKSRNNKAPEKRGYDPSQKDYQRKYMRKKRLKEKEAKGLR